MKVLLSKGAMPNVQNPSTQFTPLHWACIHGATDLVRLLLENNAQQYIPDSDGKFPIDYAGYFKHTETVKLLIRHTLRKID
jgi:ankyrin repeat protein